MVPRGQIEYWPPTPDQRLAREEDLEAADARVHKEMLKPNTFLLYVKKLPADVREEAGVLGLFTDTLRRGGEKLQLEVVAAVVPLLPWGQSGLCTRGSACQRRGRGGGGGAAPEQLRAWRPKSSGASRPNRVLAAHPGPAPRPGGGHKGRQCPRPQRDAQAQHLPANVKKLPRRDGRGRGPGPLYGYLAAGGEKLQLEVVAAVVPLLPWGESKGFANVAVRANDEAAVEEAVRRLNEHDPEGAGRCLEAEIEYWPPTPDQRLAREEDTKAARARVHKEMLKPNTFLLYVKKLPADVREEAGVVGLFTDALRRGEEDLQLEVVAAVVPLLPWGESKGFANVAVRANDEAAVAEAVRRLNEHDPEGAGRCLEAEIEYWPPTPDQRLAREEDLEAANARVHKEMLKPNTFLLYVKKLPADVREEAGVLGLFTDTLRRGEEKLQLEVVAAVVPLLPWGQSRRFARVAVRAHDEAAVEEAVRRLNEHDPEGAGRCLEAEIEYWPPTPDQRLAREEDTKAADARVHKEMLKPNTFLLYVKKLPADVREEAGVLGLFTDAFGVAGLGVEVVAAVVPLLPWGESKGFAHVAVRANDEAAVEEAVRRLNEHDPEGAGRCLEAEIEYWPPTPDQRLAREEDTKDARARVHKEMLKPNTFLLYVKKLPADVREEAGVVGLFMDALRRGEEGLQLEVVAAVVPLLPWGESKGFANVAVRANDEAAVEEAVRRLNEHDPEGAGRCLEAEIEYWPPTPDQRLAREEDLEAANARVHKEMLKPNTFLLYVKKLPADVREEAGVLGLFTDAFVVAGLGVEVVAAVVPLLPWGESKGFAHVAVRANDEAAVEEAVRRLNEHDPEGAGRCLEANHLVEGMVVDQTLE